MRFFACLLISLGTVSTLLGAPPEETGVDACAAAKIFAARGGIPPLSGDGADGSEGGLAGISDETDVLHYDITLDINPTTQVLSGTTVATVQAVFDGVTHFSVRLDTVFTISALTSNGNAVTSTRPSYPVVDIALDRTYNAGEIFDVAITYSGVPNGTGFGSIVFTSISGSPIVFTLSEPNLAYTWWPAKDFSNYDKANGDMHWSVPSTYIVASNGLLVGTTPLSGGRTRYDWHTDYVMAPYLFSFSAAPYNQFEGVYDYGTGTMPLKFFIIPGDDTPTRRNAWLFTQTMLGTFGTKYGLYPFINEKYGIYEFGFGGGQEHQTMTGEGTWDESVNAHELSHQWWGDNVTCGTFNHIWCNEGFATYSEAIWFENKPGAAPGALHTAMAARRPSSVNGTVYVPDSSLNDINRLFSTSFTYRKPGWVLHMLRHIMGDEMFFATLLDYRAQFENHGVTTEDFQGVCEAHYDASLEWFFHEWIYLPGAPAYRSAWRQITIGGVNYVELMLNQVQMASYPRFMMPVDVVTTRSSVSTTQVMWNSGSSQYFLFRAPTSVVDSLAVDPTPWILATSNTTVAFVEGPPRIVSFSPAPDARLATGSSTPVQIVFHKAVNSNASMFTLTRDGNPVSTSFVYSSGTNTATLTPAGPWPVGHYTLTVSDAVTDTGARHLDGEYPGTAPGPLPTGDGFANGSSTVHFTVYLPGDMNCDGVTNNFDIDGFVQALTDPAGYSASHPNCDLLNADANSDGVVNNFDIDPFVLLLTH